MKGQLKLATASDLEPIRRMMHGNAGTNAGQTGLSGKPDLASCLDDQCLFVYSSGSSLVGVACVCPVSARLEWLQVEPAYRRKGIGRRLLAASEKAMVSFGCTRLEVAITDSTLAFFQACGYWPMKDKKQADGGKNRFMRSFPRRKTRFSRRIDDIFEQLEVDHCYGRERRLQLQPEATLLECIGKDVFDRDQFLVPAARRAWHAMQEEAAKQDVTIQAVSAFRSVDYQAKILAGKIEKGIPMRQILAVSAAPGYSEHHSGRAIDVTTPGFEVLEEEFEGSKAFAWLNTHAKDFGFRLSYPRDNRHGILYEPWHWYFSG